MRLPLLLLAALLALLPPAFAGRTAPVPIAVRAVPLDAGDPARRRIGRLTFTGGWALSSRDRRFGGLSALVAIAPGRLLALSDSAVPVQIVLGRAGPMAGLLSALDIGDGGASGKAGADTEALARDPATGRLWAALERRNLILRLSPALVPEARQAPAAMADWPSNGGAESLALLPDGRMLAIAEKAGPRDGMRHLLLFPSDPTARPAPPLSLAYRPPAGFDPSDAAALPDGRVLVLNRRASLMEGGFTAVVTLIDPARARAGAVLAGIEIAALSPPLTVDNMEGIAVSRDADGLIVYLVSDDNFLPIQRTLLMRFRLEL